MKGHLYSSALNTFAPVMGIGLKKSLMPFVWLASIALRLEPVAFFWESIDGTPIASNNRANSVWRISVCPARSVHLGDDASSCFLVSSSEITSHPLFETVNGVSILVEQCNEVGCSPVRRDEPE